MRPIADLAAEMGIDPAVLEPFGNDIATAHPLRVGSRRAEAVNAPSLRSSIGHELAKRAAYGPAWGVVYRITGSHVDVSIYSIGDVDVAHVAGGYGGGGHRNAAGFSVSLKDWTQNFLEE